MAAPRFTDQAQRPDRQRVRRAQPVPRLRGPLRRADDAPGSPGCSTPRRWRSASTP
ncbi:hypothetical protein [Nocardioides convexus]|uniref:hypothetical protein n=1 Tax=Nocardioides convexus TaxID=2712224 RepID=UPI002418A8CC|nr:hypothetical protein [Nocardioides convexus]